MNIDFDRDLSHLRDKPVVVVTNAAGEVVKFCQPQDMAIRHIAAWIKAGHTISTWPLRKLWMYFFDEPIEYYI